MGSYCWAAGRSAQIITHHVLLPLHHWDEQIIPPTNQSPAVIFCTQTCSRSGYSKILKIFFCSSISFLLHLLLLQQLCHAIQGQSNVSSSKILIEKTSTCKRWRISLFRL